MLRKKQGQIRDTIAAYEKRLLEAQHDLAHVNATLRLFAASGEPEDFPPYVDLNRVFRRGETTTFCFERLQEEGPMDTKELTFRLMRHKKLDETDKVLWNAVSLRIVQTMRVHKRRGKIGEAMRRRGVCVWQIDPMPPFAASTPSMSERRHA